jgi:hypothetical protein
VERTRGRKSRKEEMIGYGWCSLAIVRNANHSGQHLFGKILRNRGCLEILEFLSLSDWLPTVSCSTGDKGSLSPVGAAI